MRFPPPGHFRAAEPLRARLRELGAGFDLDDAVAAGGALAQRITVAGRQLDNRFCAQPMEGWDGTADGAPSAHTLRRWRNFGRSGCALVWGGEAFAVQGDGRANPRQLCLHGDSERDLAALLAELRAGRVEVGLNAGAALVGLQLTHSGRFSRPHGPLQPRIAQHHPLLARKYALPATAALLTDGELEATGERFVAAAMVAQRAGFLFVDIKCCHGYLLHELLAARTRPGPYGGDALAARMRLFERIVRDIRRDCPGLRLGVRLSAADTAPFRADVRTGVGEPMPHDGLDLSRHHFGWLPDATTSDPDLGEAIAFLRRARELGIELANVTLGSPYWNPHLQRPAAYPPSDGYLPPADPLVFVGAHLRCARTLKRAVPDLCVVGTGYTYLQEWLPHVAQWAVARGDTDFVGLGRLLLSYPELPSDLLAGRPLQHKRLCRTFSDCTTAPRNGMVSGCFPLDPYYRSMPEAARVKLLKQDLRQ
jgi:2,4-dienoyl-CoA reductase-like NADH-dependent reductase (Old Yellow Enzyme family)